MLQYIGIRINILWGGFIMDETKEIEIDLRKIFYMMRSKVIFIILITISFGVAAGLFTHFFVDPIYQTSCSMCVYNNPDRITTAQGISQNDLIATQELVETYMFILKSDVVLDKVAEDLDLGSGSAIKSYVSASSVPDTIAFKVIVSCKDPQLAVDIANSIAKVAPTEMAKAVNAGGVKVIDTAKLPRTPSSPNTKKNILVGVAIGFILSFVGFFVYEMFDTTITNAKDLERDFELPVLGTIPMLENVEKGNNGSDSKGSSNDDLPAPSPALLENIQSMKGDAKND